MSRHLRFIPEGGALVEVTCRTLHSRLLFRPSPRLNQIILGIFARAKHRYGVRVCFFVCVSNHLHLLLEVDDARQLARFMGAFTSKLAREVGRLTGWRQKIFSRRYQAIVVSEEEAAQIERLRYSLAHGAKEDLVERPRDWPGVHAVRALLEGEVLEGLWFDRTKEYLARRRGEKFDSLHFATREILGSIRCHAGSIYRNLSGAGGSRLSWRTSSTKLPPAERGREPDLWSSRRSGPGSSPATKEDQDVARAGFSCSEQSHAPRARNAYALFVAAYRDAAEKLRAGIRDVVFPQGSFPPSLPFVGG